MPKYDKVFYISLIQDSPTAKAEELFIHNKQVIFVKIPVDTDLNKFTDKKLNDISPRSKIYFSAHGIQEYDSIVFNRRDKSAQTYTLDQVANFIAKLLPHAAFRDPNEPRLTLVLSVCEGTGFARNLQMLLLKNYGIYIDVIANKNVVHEYFSYDEENSELLNILKRETSIGNSGKMIYKRPHSKVLLTIDQTGNQKEIDCYEFKWIGEVITTLHAQLQKFMKWADFDNIKNVDISKNMLSLISQIDEIIKSTIEADTNLTANLILALLLKIEQNPDNYLAMKHDPFCYAIFDLSNEGKKYVDQDFGKSNAPSADHFDNNNRDFDPKELEYVAKIIEAQKVKLSSLLEEASKMEDKTDIMDEIYELQSKIKNLKTSYHRS